MPDTEDINDTIAQTAADGIKNVSISGQHVESLSIDDQIKAANHVAAQSAARGSFGLRFSKLIPPGCG
jgi:hypothetical protein